MKPLYTIDSGNSLLKISKFNQEGKLLTKDIISTINDYVFEEGSTALFCSVNQSFPKLKIHALNIDDIKGTLDFKTEYSQSLGNDRFALSYYLQKTLPNKKIIVVSAGTFLTIDYIDNGLHLGGHIFQGISTFLKTYGEKGKNLPMLDNITSTRSLIPKNTNEAIFSAVHKYLEMIFSEISKDDFEVIVTGGDAKYFKDFEVDPNLLDKALFFILQQVL